MCVGAARHAVSAVPRCAQPRQDLRRPAVLRRRVRADHGAARVPDGRRAAGALEEGRDSRPGAAAQVGAGRQLRHRAHRSLHRRTLDTDDRVRPVPRVLGHRLGGRRHQGARAAPQGRARGAPRGAGPRLLGHAARAPGRRGVHPRGHARQGLRGRARRAHGRRRHVDGRQLRVQVRGHQRSPRAQLHRRPRHGRSHEERQVRRAPVSGKAHLQRAADADDRGRDRLRRARRPVRLARRAGRQRRLERAHLLQAVHHLDLGRLRADGDRRARRAVGSSLSAARAPRRQRSKARRRRA